MGAAMWERVWLMIVVVCVCRLGEEYGCPVEVGKRDFLLLPTSLLYSLHWLPNSSQVQNKMALICIVSGTAPTNLSELLHLYFPFVLSLQYPVLLGWAGGS